MLASKKFPSCHDSGAEEDIVATTQGEEDADDSSLYCTEEIDTIKKQQILSPEEEEAWLGKYFSKQLSTTTMDDHMTSLEKEFEESMNIASAATAASSKKNKNTSEDAMHKVYAELHSQADAEIIQKLKMAMDCIPENTKGLADCKNYFSSKQHYTLQDILVAQYVLNDGLLMRQNHGMDDEYHVDITEPLV